MRTTQTIRYLAEPKHVREVTLRGSADFGFWSDYLRSDGLAPLRYSDAAQVLIVSAQMAYLGVRFTEMSFSVRSALRGDESSAGMWLLHAYTSSRVFAWCERMMFAAPYSCGACKVSVQRPPSARLDTPGGCVLIAEMSSATRSATQAGYERWEGPVFLPSRGAARDGRLFFGRLSGHTVVYPFTNSDRFAMELSAGGEVLQPLVDSRFIPHEWVVRADATHGKSKTYRRTDIFACDNAA